MSVLFPKRQASLDLKAVPLLITCAEQIMNPDGTGADVWNKDTLRPAEGRVSGWNRSQLGGCMTASLLRVSVLADLLLDTLLADRHQDPFTWSRSVSSEKPVAPAFSFAGTRTPPRLLRRSCDAAEERHDSPSRCRITATAGRLRSVTCTTPPPLAQLSKYRERSTLNDLLFCWRSFFEMFNLIPPSLRVLGWQRRKLEFLVIIQWKMTLMCTCKYVFKWYTCRLVILDFLIGKPAVCARFSTHPWSPVIHKQIQEIASSESEPYVITRSSLAELLLFVCSTAVGAREAERAWDTKYP